MTLKEILKIAADDEAMEILKEIAEIQSNMCHKTIYEQATAKKKMKRLAKEIAETIH